jgi:lysozyme
MNGIDVSHHQGQIDWPAVRQSGICFAFIKSTEALTFTDPMFVSNWEAAKNAGIIRGAYHFFRPQAHPEMQASHFLAQLKNDPGELPPVLDVEVLDGLAPRQLLARAKACADAITRTLTRPILYTGASFWRDTLEDSAAFAAHPLWIAHHTSALSPTVPNAWSTWTFWQHSQHGCVPGINGHVDLNRSNSAETATFTIP